MSIRDAIHTFDSWIIERLFEPLLWRIEYKLGWTKYTCACIVFLPCPPGLVAATLHIPWNGLKWFCVTLALIGTTLLYLSILVAEHKEKLGFIPHEREKYVGRRVRGALLLMCFVFLVLISPPSSLSWMLPLLLAEMGDVASEYCLASSRMPPTWREERNRAKESRLTLSAQPT